MATQRRHKQPRARLSFQRDERGSATIWGLFSLLIFMLLGGLALDATQAWRVQTILQNVADAAAQSAGVHLSEGATDDEARAVAADIALSGLSATHLSDAYSPDRVEFGQYNSETGIFTVGATPTRAVQVTLKRTKATGNAEPTQLLGMVGLPSWDVSATAIAAIERKARLTCVDPLLSLRTNVDVRGINAYVATCVHADVDLYYGGEMGWANTATSEFVDALLAKSLGLDLQPHPLPEEQGLVGGLVGGLLGGLLGGSGAAPEPDWETKDLYTLINRVVTRVDQTIDITAFDPTALYVGDSVRVTCDDLDVLTLLPGTVLRGVTLISDCPVKFEADVDVQASLIVTNLKALLASLGPASVLADVPTGGDDCAPGSGVRIFVFADLDIAVTVPALVSTDSPLGEFLADVVDLLGGLLGGVLDLLGALLSGLIDIVSGRTEVLNLAGVCIGGEVMLDADVITLANR